MTDLKVTAYLDTPVIGIINPLDAVLAWAVWQEKMAAGEELKPISDDFIEDFPLPLATWEKDGYWGWCASAAVMEAVHYSSVEVRRRPPTGPMAAYTRAKEHHAGLGELKARNTTLEATHYKNITWQVDCTDQQRLEHLLSMCTHLGGRHRNGFGHITRWDITEGEPGGWRKRHMPAPHGRMMRVRAPYWHTTERTTCA